MYHLVRESPKAAFVDLILTQSFTDIFFFPKAGEWDFSSLRIQIYILLKCCNKCV